MRCVQETHGNNTITAICRFEMVSTGIDVRFVRTTYNVTAASKSKPHPECLQPNVKSHSVGSSDWKMRMNGDIVDGGGSYHSRPRAWKKSLECI